VYVINSYRRFGRDICLRQAAQEAFSNLHGFIPQKTAEETTNLALYTSVSEGKGKEGKGRSELQRIVLC
jgi:hypothetical protein